MGQHSCCNKQKVKRGLWSPEEDEKLINYISTYGHGCWSTVPRRAGLQRCGKSCRLRWINYLRPDLKRGSFSPQEAGLIIDLHKLLGNKWAQIAKHLPGRTDNEVKNFWNSSIKKKLVAHGIPEIPIFPHLSSNNYNEVPNFHHQPSAFMNNPLPQQNPNFSVPNNPNPSFFHGVDQFFPQPHHEFNNFPDQGTVFNQSWPNFQPQNNLFQASNGQIQPQQVVIGGGDGGDQMVVAGAIVANDGGDPLLPPLEPAGNSQEVDPMEQLSSLLMSADSLRSGDALSAPADWFSQSIESLMSMVTATSSSTSSSTSCSQMAKNPNQAPAPGSWAP